jgi:hypothetical protein
MECAPRAELEGGASPFEVGVVRKFGDIGIRERLTVLSDRDMTFAYNMLPVEPLPVRNYCAELQVFAVSSGESQCFVKWTAEFDVAPNTISDAEAECLIRDGVFAANLQKLEKLLRNEEP